MEVYEIEGELILGLPHEIGYKIMDFAPDSFVARAEISHEYFELMLEAIAYADLNGFNVPANAPCGKSHFVITILLPRPEAFRCSEK
jgi:hypothetical protein